VLAATQMRWNRFDGAHGPSFRIARWTVARQLLFREIGCLHLIAARPLTTTQMVRGGITFRPQTPSVSLVALVILNLNNST